MAPHSAVRHSLQLLVAWDSHLLIRNAKRMKSWSMFIVLLGLIACRDNSPNPGSPQSAYATGVEII